MNSLEKILVGIIKDIPDTGSALQNINMTVISTVLSNTLELQNLTLDPQVTPRIAKTKPFLTLQQYLGYIRQNPGEKEMWNRVNIIKSASYTMPLRQALEELFQNITISLMTSAVLQ